VRTCLKTVAAAALLLALAGCGTPCGSPSPDPSAPQAQHGGAFQDEDYIWEGWEYGPWTE